MTPTVSVFLRTSVTRNDVDADVSFLLHHRCPVRGALILSNILELKAKKKECGCNEEAKCIGCDQPCAPVFKPCQEEYYPGGKCFCKEGFLRFYDGECRPADQCMLRG